MAANTSIEWCDHTWTPVVGCDPVSPACANCYAATMAARLEAMGQEKYRGIAIRVGGKGKWTGKVNFWEPELVKPLTVRKPGRWFLTSMGDVAHDLLTDEQIAELFGVMAVAGAYTAFCMPRGHGGPHTFMVLTKRPARLAQMLLSREFRMLVARAARRWAKDRVDMDWLADGISGGHPLRRDPGFWPMPNVFIGCTAEDQQRADELRPHMAGLAAAGWRTFVSYEPALGPVDWTGWEFLRQLISGGESGHKARPSHPDWHRAARDFAAAHGIAYLFKQWGEWGPDWEGAETCGHCGHAKFDAVNSRGECGQCGSDSWQPAAKPLDKPRRAGKKAAGRLLDGREHNEFPGAPRCA